MFLSVVVLSLEIFSKVRSHPLHFTSHKEVDVTRKDVRVGGPCLNEKFKKNQYNGVLLCVFYREEYISYS